MSVQSKKCPVCQSEQPILLQVCDCGHIFFGHSRKVRAIATKNREAFAANSLAVKMGKGFLVILFAMVVAKFLYVVDRQALFTRLTKIAQFKAQHPQVRISQSSRDIARVRTETTNVAPKAGLKRQ